MTYATNAAGSTHQITVRVDIASGFSALSASTASGTFPLLQVASVGATLNPLTTRRELAGVSIELADTAAVRQMMAPAFGVQAVLSEPVGPSDLSLTLRPGDGARLAAYFGALPWSVHLGAESVEVTNQVADVLTVVRGAGAGLFATDAVSQPAGTTLGASVQRWVGRPIYEVASYPDGSEEVVASYACDTPPRYEDGRWVIPCQDLLGHYNRQLARGLSELTILDATGYGLPAGRTPAQGFLVSPDACAEDPGAPGTYHLLGFWIRDDNGPRTLYTNHLSGNPWPGVLVTAAGKPPGVWFTLGGVDVIAPLRPLPGDTYQPHIRVAGQFSRVVLWLLTSRLGDFANGANDVLLGSARVQVGAGINDARVDMVQILRELPRHQVAIWIKPGDMLLDVLERELAWVGRFVDVDRAGLLTVRRVRYPVHLSESDWTLDRTTRSTDSADALAISARIVNRIEVSAGFDPVKGHTYRLVMPGGSGPDSGLDTVGSFEPTWLPAPRTSEALDAFEDEMLALLSRWGRPHPHLVLEHAWTAHRVRVGDVVAVVHERLPNGQGGQGLEVSALVTAVESDLEAGSVRVEVEALGGARSGYIAPAGEVVAVTPLGGADYRLQFQTPGGSRLISELLQLGSPSPEAGYFAPGWAVRGYDYQTGATMFEGFAIATAGLDVTVTATLGVPVVGPAGDPTLVTVSDYDAGAWPGPSPATMPPDLDDTTGNKRPGLLPLLTVPGYVYAADAAGGIGAAPDAAMEWI